ncbi:MAG TPA: citrate transporter [Acidimicrobiaceae bacterium]|nr:citrate transporter [Acidimicrobiaceae bacterium]
MGAVILLVVGVATLFVRPRRVPLWAGPSACAILALATTIVPWHDVSYSVRLLRDPLLFLAFAVPLAVLLDRIGVFAALAALVDGGRHLVAWLWVLAAAVTVVFNLDAAVVLLTPLYIRIARRHGLSAEMLAFQPALLACLASSPLPVSNLTNLIVAERFDLGLGDFVRHLSLPTVLAVVVGWVGFRWAFHLHAESDGVDEPVDGQALRRGLPVVLFVLVGFTAGELIGVPAWVVAATATLWCVGVARAVPWRALPFEAALVAVSLTVLVAGAVPHLGLSSVLSGNGEGVRAVLFGVIASNAANNLPAVLAGSASLASPDQVWPLLLGVNMGPVMVLTGALSGLLWRDTARTLGVEVSMRRYSSVGVRVGLPALIAAAASVLLLG